jgi:putative ABC transport system substrate-binding protein
VKQAARDTPIVTVACDPLDRLIVSLSAPGGSATGLSCVSSELAGKRLEMLKELVPGVVRAAVIYNGTDPNKALEFKQLDSAGARLGVAVTAYAVAQETEFADSFARMADAQTQAVVVLVDAFTIFHRQRLADLALERRLPSVFGFKEFVEAGGLLSYGASRRVLFGRAAAYVDKILKGANAGELPVEEPTVFELYINRKTADALGLAILPTLLARADEVIE